MRSFYTIVGLGGIILICFGIPDLLQRYEVQTKGSMVDVVLTQVPAAKGSIEFVYAGKQYDAKVGGGFHELHQVGDTFQMKHLAGNEYFLFEKEKMELQFASMGIFVVVCLILIFKGLRTKDS